MGWLDRLRGRRPESSADDGERAESEEEVADELEEGVHDARDQQVLDKFLDEPRPPGG
jgi:hypothetical protein